MPNKERINAVNVRLAVFIVFVFSLVLVFSVTGAFAASTVDPWEVKLYTQPDFLGSSLSYRMVPGMRHKLVEQLPQGFEDRVSSIEVGDMVAVTVFDHRHWSGDNFICSASDTQIIGWNPSSIIVFPKAAENPQGVWLWDVSYDTFTMRVDPQHLTFFPLPELEKDTEARYASLGHVDLDKNANVVHTQHEAVEVTLYEGRNFTGASLTLPGPGGWALIDPCMSDNRPLQGVYEWTECVNFGKYNWSDRAASLVVRWKGPPLGGPSPSGERLLFFIYPGTDLPGQDYKRFMMKGGYDECLKACGSDLKCLAFTSVAPGVQGADAVCYLKSGVPSSAQNPNCVSGVRAHMFEITQGMDLLGQDYKKFSVKGGFDECEKTCVSDPKCLAFTWVKPGVQGADAVCYLKSGVPNATQNPNCVSGVRKFNITQGLDLPGQDYNKFMMIGDYVGCEKACGNDAKCLAYTWVKPGVKGADAACCLKSGVPSSSIQDPNCISGVRRVLPATPVSAKVNAPPTGPDNRYAPTAPAYAAKEKAQPHSKQTTGPAPVILPEIPDVSGQWKGSNGLVYDIKQVKDRFEWTVRGKDEKGAGVLNGRNISAKWKRGTDSGSFEGKITGLTTPGNTATQIDWSNGLRFYR